MDWVDYNLGSNRATILKDEPDYPWIVRHEVQLLINRINNKIRD